MDNRSLTLLTLYLLVDSCSCGSLLDPTTPVEALTRKGTRGEDMHLGKGSVVVM